MSAYSRYCLDIYLIRHTSPAIATGICYGQSDIDVSSSFETEATNVLTKLPNLAEAVIYSSPLKRCQRLAEKLGQPYLLDPRLMELNFGMWELQHWHEIDRAALDAWGESYVTSCPPEGESYAMLYARSVAFLDELKSSLATEIIVVTHRGIICSLLVQILKLPLEKAFDFQIDYGSVSKFTLEGDSAKVIYLNR